MTLAGKDARLGLMTPIAIRMPEVQCARVWVGVMLPHNRSLSRLGEDASLCVFYQSGVKEMFHGSHRSWVDYREGSQQLSTTWQEGLLCWFRSEESEII